MNLIDAREEINIFQEYAVSIKEYGAHVIGLIVACWR